MSRDEFQQCYVSIPKTPAAVLRGVVCGDRGGREVFMRGDPRC